MKNIFTLILVLTGFMASCQTENRAAKWSEDISYFDNQLRSNHKNLFHQIPETEYKKSIEDLKSKIDVLSDFDIVTGLSKIATSIGDSHTFLHPEGATQNYVPLIISLFEEGFYVTYAKPAYKNLLKGRLVKINSTPADEMYKFLRLTMSSDQGNEMSYKFLSTNSIRSKFLKSVDLHNKAFMGKTREDNLGLFLFDKDTKTRFRAYIDTAGNAKIEFLDRMGKIMYSLPN